MRLLMLVLLALTALAQPKFEVASIKPFDPRASRGQQTGMTVTGDQVNITGLSVTQLIVQAYGTEMYRVTGPNDIGLRFSITAKFPAGATASQLPIMLRSLLTERLGLQLHEESKEVSGYNLVVASDGHKMKPAVDDDTPPFSMDELNASGRDVPGMTLNSQGDGSTRMTFTKMPMLGLTRFLSTIFREPVFDRTGLNGNFQGTFNFSYPGLPGRTLANEILIPDSVKPLGLRLERTKGPVTMYVVDKVNTTPTEN
jgi:uncharacterized protein (TIGR03435 family)